MIILEELGWSSRRDDAFQPHRDDGLVPARVLAEHRQRLRVATADGDRNAVLGGRFRRETTDPYLLPAVGDWVAVRDSAGDGPVRLESVLPRTSALVRRAPAGWPGAYAGDAQVLGANLETVILVMALDRELAPRRLERFLAFAWESGAQPLVVLSKADAMESPEAALDEARSLVTGTEVLLVSALHGVGVEQVSAHLVPRETVAFVGQSGAGKSTLLNRLAGENRMHVSHVRDSDGRGRHTTTHRELHRLPGGALVIDTPGIRELSLWEGEEGADAAYSDVSSLADRCRFRDCLHDAEPGCAVLGAVESGDLDGERLAGWHKVRRDEDRLATRADAAAVREHKQAIKRFGRVVKEAVDDRERRRGGGYR